MVYCYIPRFLLKKLIFVEKKLDAISCYANFAI